MSEIYDPSGEFDSSEIPFGELRERSEDELKEMGLKRWSEESGLWLFPVEWFEEIPDGFEVTTINGKTEEFWSDQKIKEARFGCLPYGIEVSADE